MTPARGPCGSGDVYADCCGPRHDGSAPAPTAEALMRSRFSAFATGDAAYLWATWHPSTRPDVVALDETLRWTRLDVVDVVGGGPYETTGTVEFRAHHRGADGTAGGRGVQHERSSFVREDGRWYYVAGVVDTAP